MRFGLLLLALIAVCSVIGTVIPQGREIAWYAQTYKSFHGTILMLKLNDVFHSWYFELLLVLLGLNLTLCSLLRIRSVRAIHKKEKEYLLTAPATLTLPLSEEQKEYVVKSLRAMHCREEKLGDAVIFSKNGFGRYGSFITHLSILLILIAVIICLLSEGWFS